MPIYEYYCPDNHTVYQFYAKSLAQGRTVPKCPENPAFRMVRMLSSFAVVSGGAKGEADSSPAAGGQADADDPRMEGAMAAMEREFANVDENDPKAMGRMMRRMAELTGEKLDGEMEEVVRKLEEGTDPEALDEQFGGEEPCGDECGCAPEEPTRAEGAEKPRRAKRLVAPRKDPKLYDYE
ncbi:MAG: FmdB family transcriptional regulator [Opitutaceae bacterium]|nr:FmdB family transcriptional regulator [Opitutaceae bacterium]